MRQPLRAVVTSIFTILDTSSTLERTSRRMENFQKLIDRPSVHVNRQCICVKNWHLYSSCYWLTKGLMTSVRLDRLGSFTGFRAALPPALSFNGAQPRICPLGYLRRWKDSSVKGKLKSIIILWFALLFFSLCWHNMKWTENSQLNFSSTAFTSKAWELLGIPAAPFKKKHEGALDLVFFCKAPSSQFLTLHYSKWLKQLIVKQWRHKQLLDIRKSNGLGLEIERLMMSATYFDVFVIGSKPQQHMWRAGEVNHSATGPYLLPTPSF